MDTLLKLILIPVVVIVIGLIIEYWFIQPARIPGPDKLLEAVESNSRLYGMTVWIWQFVPRRLRTFILRRVNPSVTLGALAVIVEPYSAGTDRKVLLGWHSYHTRQRTPWGLLGGALKKRDQEVSDPAQTVVREVREETGLDIEVTKLLAIDTDWDARTMDFYFECILRKGLPDLTAPLQNPEIIKLDWFRLSELPDNMYPQHKRWLAGVLPRLPRLPGVCWTADQQPATWWGRFHRAEQIRRQLLNSTQDPSLTLATLVNEARDILKCEVVSFFATEPPIQIVSPAFSPPTDITGDLRLIVESSKLRGTLSKPEHVILPLSPSGKKLGLTAWLVRAQPLGRTIRLHESWLHEHPHVKSWRNHDHLADRTCHSLAAVSVLGQNKVLGLLKAENKMRDVLSNYPDNFVPFGPDDGYIMEEFAPAAASLLERMASGD